MDDRLVTNQPVLVNGSNSYYYIKLKHSNIRITYFTYDKKSWKVEIFNVLFLFSKRRSQGYIYGILYMIFCIGYTCHSKM